MQDSRVIQWMKTIICESFLIEDVLVEEALQFEKNKLLLDMFISGKGLNKILVFYQKKEQIQNYEIKDTGIADPVLFLTTGDSQKLQDKAVWFMRIKSSIDVDEKDGKKLVDDNENDIIFGEITQNTILMINSLMVSKQARQIGEIIGEILETTTTENRSDFWGVDEQESIEEFQQFSSKFSDEVKESINLLILDTEQFNLDTRLIEDLNESQKMQLFEQKFNVWVNSISSYLNDDSKVKKEDKNEVGPTFELIYWRRKMQKISNWSEQLRNKDLYLIKQNLERHKQQDSQLSRGRGDETISKVIMRCKLFDLLLTEKLNEAKDNVKYLTSFEKFIEPLYNGTHKQKIDDLPALMNTIKALHTIAKFYNTTEKTTDLFIKITNQIIKNRKDRILSKKDEVIKMVYPDIEKRIQEVILTESYLVNSTSFQLKIIQLYEICRVNHGFMLVGPSGSGKSTILKILTESMTKLGLPHKLVIINPKAITAEQMYGIKSVISDDCIPGVFSTIWKQSNNRNLQHTTWITCDGPVDPTWIENLNTVLDENKILTQANGDRIAMTENCKVVFEVENLNNVSPSTVSRCGQVYVSLTDLGYEAVIKGWLRYRKGQGRSEESDKLAVILKKYLIDMDLIEQQANDAKELTMNVSPFIKIINILNLLTGCLMQFVSDQKTLNENEYEKFAVFSIAWAVGGTYEVLNRTRFHEFLLSKNAPMPPKSKENETIFDYYVSSESLDWKLCIPEIWVPPKEIQFSQLLLPTLDSFRAEMLFNFILSQPKNHQCSNSALLIGYPGTAKTSSVLLYCNKLNSQKMLFKRINFSSSTSPFMFQSAIEAECDYQVGKEFSTSENKMMTIFIDDMSMPSVNKWGDQITLEFVRQLIETGGFYMLDKTQRGNQCKIKNLQYIGAMNHPRGGRNDIPNRLKRQFFIFNIILSLSIERIYGPIIKHMLKSTQFTEEANKVIEQLTSATIALWYKVKSAMHPTPIKFHYVFNMRDFSSVFKGILTCKKETILESWKSNKIQPELFLVGLWRYEAERVFVDKLVNNKDKEKVLSFIHEISLESFSQLANEISEKFSSQQVFVFCDFLHPDVINEEGKIEEEAPKIYEAIDSLTDLRKRCNFLLDFFNDLNPSKQMNLVLFKDALSHLIRISRIIRQPRSSGLLVGVGGSGKQSLTRLAAFIGKNLIQQIIVTKTYSDKDLRDDIKKGFDDSGHLGKQVTFLMTDAEIKKEEFLEYINMVLSTGEIPNLLTKEEREVLLGDLCQLFIKEKGIVNADPHPNELWTYFVDRVRDNFHVMLCFSPAGEKFRERARKFPALFNECIIDWFLPLTEESLVNVAETFINNFQKLDTKEDTKQQLIKHMANVHLMVSETCEKYYQKMKRQVYVTPKTFVSYLNSFKILYTQKYDELNQKEKSFKIGLNQIKENTFIVKEAEISREELEYQLNESNEKVDILLGGLEKENKKMNYQREKIAKCEADVEQTLKEWEDSHRQLEELLQFYQEAVDSIESKDLAELKASKRPLEIIKYIMDVVLIFFKAKIIPISIEERVFNKKESKDVLFLKESYEEYGIQILREINFIKKIKEYEKDSINEEIIELLEPYMNQTKVWFNEKFASKASKAASGILKWAMANLKYHQKLKIINLKRKELTIAEGRLADAKNELDKARIHLTEIQAYINSLKQVLSYQMEEKHSLEMRGHRRKLKTNVASQLIACLSGEVDHWSKYAQNISDEKCKLAGNSSLATAFISYCGPFNAEFRNNLVQNKFIVDMKKLGIPFTLGLELTSFLIDDATIGEWSLQGLPNDDFSIQNGIIVTNSTRFPLFIDPQGQGKNWIRNMFSPSIQADSCITTLSHPQFKDMILKYCMENGITLIIENIENEVDPMMGPVLERQIIIKGKAAFINVSGTEMEFSKQFKLFMTCSLTNPSFSPELSAKTTIIDFTITQSGLEQQLLGKIIAKEQKALENSLNQLLTKVNQNKKELQRLEKRLLERLTNSRDSFIYDTELMDVLFNTKIQAKKLEAQLINAEIKIKEINEKREQYRPVAIRGSVIYFTMIEVSQVNWMYYSSFEQFLKLFMESIDFSKKAEIPSQRVKNIISFLTFYSYSYLNRGLFEKDKIAFILTLTFNILKTAGTISNSDVSLFLNSGDSPDIKSECSKPSYLKDKQWLNILALSKHSFSGQTQPFFKELPDLVTVSEKQWSQWIDKNDPENFPIPDFAETINQEKEIGSFISLCLIRSLRNDRILVAISNFIQSSLGKQFTDPISYPIKSLLQESSQFDPILFLVSDGDPTSSIDELAKKQKKFPCIKVSMGEGQERVARQAILKSFAEGRWVILENCNLEIKYKEVFETLLSPQQAFHDDFRFWIACEQHPKFPLGLLQKSFKVTNDLPNDLKAGLSQTFTTIIYRKFIEKVDNFYCRSLLFTVSFLHSVTIENKKLNSIWLCAPYEYNYSDHGSSLLYIENYLTNLIPIFQLSSHNLLLPMKVIRFIICQVQYGGRISDDFYRELFNTYSETFLKNVIFGSDYFCYDFAVDEAGQKIKCRIPAKQTEELEKYQECISKIPTVDNAEVNIEFILIFLISNSKDFWFSCECRHCFQTQRKQ